MKITQLINSNGNAATNQFNIQTNKGNYFQSYQTIIAFQDRYGNTPVLSSAWDCSATTLKHLKLFLCTSLSKKEIQKRIDAGSIIVTDIITVE